MTCARKTTCTRSLNFVMVTVLLRPSVVTMGAARNPVLAGLLALDRVADP